MDLITFNCSACQQVLKVGAENAGKQAKCPRCGAMMVIPSAGGAPPVAPVIAGGPQPYNEPPPRRRSRDDDDYDDRPRSRRRDDDYDDRGPRRRPREDDDYDDRGPPRGMSPRKKWGFVKLGILLVAIAACGIAAYAAMQTITDMIVMIAVISKKGMEGKAAVIIIRIGHGFAFGAGLLALVGYVFCIFVPNKNGTLALAIVSLSLGGINLVMNLLTKLIPMFSVEGSAVLFMPGFGMVKESLGGAFALSIFVVLLYFVEMIIFPLFLWAAAKSVKARWAAGNCIGVMVFVCVSTGLQLLALIMTFVGMNSRSGGQGLAVTIAIIRLIASLVFLGQMIWYIIVLFRTREVAEQY